MNVNHRFFEVNSMKMISFAFVRRLLFNERGQSMVWVGVSLTAMLGLSGLTLDVGHAYVVRSQLQSVVNACSLAGVSGLPNAQNAQNAVSTCEGNDNNPSWGTVNSPNANVFCSTAVMPSTQSCTNSNILNVVQVTESVNVPTFFMRIFGYKTLPVGATATATPAEGRPLIVEFVLDTTPSMANSDSNCVVGSSAKTAEECALIGIQGMLSKLSPCPPGTKNCGPSNANIRFGLITFPNIQTSDAVYNINSNNGAGKSCASGTVKFQLYSSPVIPVVTAYNPVTGYPKVMAPVVSPSSYTPITYGPTKSGLALTYQPTFGASDMDANGFYTDYYSATGASGLNSSSTLVQAIGRNADNVDPCLQEPNTNNYNGTSGVTSFAGAIYAAETALLAEQGEYPVVNGLATRTMIVFLSDGQANTLADDFPAAGTAVTSNGVNSGGLSVLNTNGLYPSVIDACQQAITAGQYAASLGTRVYTVAYGAEVGGCLYYLNGLNSQGKIGTATSTVLQGKTNGTGSGSDVSPLVVTGTLNPPINAITDVTPCSTILNMASDISYTYSDYYQEKSGGSGVNEVDTNCKSLDPSNATLTSLNDIFQGIYGSITSARLIPNNVKSN
jgi:Flp pilus assembly protein TadG